MASLSPSFILNDVHKKKTTEKDNEAAFRLSLYSVVGGGLNPLLMTDNGEAKRQPVVFNGAANS